MIDIKRVNANWSQTILRPIFEMVSHKEMCFFSSISGICENNSIYHYEARVRNNNMDNTTIIIPWRNVWENCLLKTKLERKFLLMDNHNTSTEVEEEEVTN